MNQREINLLADTIKRAYINIPRHVADPVSYERGVVQTAVNIARAYSEIDPRFHRNTFLHQCGINAPITNTQQDVECRNELNHIHSSK
jgi:hypothetical protein